MLPNKFLYDNQIQPEKSIPSGQSNWTAAHSSCSYNSATYQSTDSNGTNFSNTLQIMLQHRCIFSGQKGNCNGCRLGHGGFMSFVKIYGMLLEMRYWTRSFFRPTDEIRHLHHLFYTKDVGIVVLVLTYQFVASSYLKLLLWPYWSCVLCCFVFFPSYFF